MSYPALPIRLLEAFDQFPNPHAALYKTGGKWEGISSAELLRRIAGLSSALAGLGIQAGDRVGLFSPNRPEWHIADFAINGLGAANVPVYFKEAPERMIYILNDSGARIVIAVGEEQAEKLLEVRGQLRSVEQIILASAPAVSGGDALHYETLIANAGDAEIAEYRRRASQVTPEMLATMIYTSGTTGEPKGVMLTHYNLSSNTTDCIRDLEHRRDDMALAFLPLAHVYERTVDYGYLFQGITIAYLESMEHVQAAMLEVRPTVMATVPRFFEKFYANLMERGKKATGLRRRLFDWGIHVARQAIPWRAYGKPAPLGLKVQWFLANGLVYPKIRAGLGGRMRSFSCGGAPLARELAEFFWALDIQIYQGYGLTETSPVVCTNVPSAQKVGTVGRPIANVEVRIAEDGEILVHGPCVMQGYYNKPEETREALTPDGWLRTGDIGYLDEDGFLVVTDRKKDLIKTAAGKFIAPQPIENRLKTSPYILNAAIVGDRRKFVCALIVPHFANVEVKAREVELEFSSDAQLAAHPWVRTLVAEEVERLTSHLAQYEKIKRFALLDHDFTFDGGQLTFTMKLKRRVIEERYTDHIQELYSDVQEPRPAAS